MPIRTCTGHAQTWLGTIVGSDGVPIVVEHAIYTNASGVIQPAGAVSLPTKLQ
jgi:hypothetical protein